MQRIIDAFRKGVSDTKKVLTMEHIFEPDVKRLDLIDFTKASTIEKFNLFTDESIGGGSEAAFYFDTDRTIFEGNLDLTVPEQKEGQRKVDNSGYAAIVCAKRMNWNLDPYDALLIEAKTDGRIYVANMQTRSYVPDDLFQSHVVGKEGEWDKIVLPFDKFTKTNRGFVAEETHMSARSVETIGLLMAQRRDGPFRIELKSISAINRDLYISEIRETRWTGIPIDSRNVD